MMIDDVDDILDVGDKTDGTEYGALRHTAVDRVYSLPMRRQSDGITADDR